MHLLARNRDSETPTAVEQMYYLLEFITPTTDFAKRMAA